MRHVQMSRHNSDGLTGASIRVIWLICGQERMECRRGVARRLTQMTQMGRGSRGVQSAESADKIAADKRQVSFQCQVARVQRNER
jgi:hypothetical protein